MPVSRRMKAPSPIPVTPRLVTPRLVTPRLVTPILVTLGLATPAVASEIGLYAEPTLHRDRIVFVSEGDLFRVDLPTPGADGRGPIEAHRVTASTVAESSPKLSPDGRWIAYAANESGNTDVYVMPGDGGVALRLTFHPGDDVPLAWSPDGQRVLFRSGRDHPFGRPELHAVYLSGGTPRRYPFGECVQISMSVTGRRFAFTPWTTAAGDAKRTRGGATPDVWIGDFSSGSFTRLTSHPGSDRHPMWLRDRVYFVSDRNGTDNLMSARSDGGDVRTHTSFAFDPERPAAVEGYDMQSPGAATERGGARIVFTQAGGLALFDTTNDAIERLDVRLLSDRRARRPHLVAATRPDGMALSADGRGLVLSVRGDLVAVDADRGVGHVLTGGSPAREWGPDYLDAEQIVLVTDGGGDPQVAVMPTDGSDSPSLVTEDRERALLAPACAADGLAIAFADVTGELFVIDLRTFERERVDRVDPLHGGGLITEYRFSPDGQWLAYVVPVDDGRRVIRVYGVRTKRTLNVSGDGASDWMPRWDPAGVYLYFLTDEGASARDGARGLASVGVVPLAAATPPPLPGVARAAGFDVAGWVRPRPPPAPREEPEEEPFAAAVVVPPDEEEGFVVIEDGLAERHVLLPLDPDAYHAMEATWGALTYLVDADRADDRVDGMDDPRELHRYDLVSHRDRTLVRGPRDYVMSRDRQTIAWLEPSGSERGSVVHVGPTGSPQTGTTVDLSRLQLRVDPPLDWAERLTEAWRLRRDLFWDKDLRDVDWPAVRLKYETLLARAGSAEEARRITRDMLAEAGAGDPDRDADHDARQAASRGTGRFLGVRLDTSTGVTRVARVLGRGLGGAPRHQSPLAASHLGVNEGVENGTVILAVNHQPLLPGVNLHAVLDGTQATSVVLTVADDARGTNRRTLDVVPIADERALLYADWAERNRALAAELSNDAIGYVHVPDLGERGLAELSRQLAAAPPANRTAMIIDLRGCTGGPARAAILQQSVWSRGETQPLRATLIVDHGTEAEAEILAAEFRAGGLGRIVGTRTRGRVATSSDKIPLPGADLHPDRIWRDASGRTPENRGLEPDVVVAPSPADRVTARDPALDAAIRELMEEN